jgi:hypothetical protein
MKLLILFMVLISGTIQAQQPFPHLQQKNQLSLLFDHSIKSPQSQLKDLNVYLNHSLPEPGIYSLSQDRMPCKVPDLNSVVAIPNSWNGKIEVPYKSDHHAIPNPVPLRKTYTYRVFTPSRH